jgi:hypothetical protein
VLGHVHHHTHEYAVARSSVKPEHGKPFSMPEPIAPPPPRPGVPKFSKRRPPPLSFVGDVTDKVNVMALRPRYGWTVRPFQDWSETELKPVTPPEEGCKRDMEFLGRDYETRNLAARTHKWTKEVQFRLYRYWGQPMPKTPPEGNMSKEERRKMNRQEELRAARAAGRKPVDKKAALLSEVKSAMGDWFRKSTVTTNLHQLEALQAQAATGAVVPSPKSSPSKSAGPTSPKTSPAKSSPPKPRESTAVVAVAEAKPG